MKINLLILMIVLSFQACKENSYNSEEIIYKKNTSDIIKFSSDGIENKKAAEKYLYGLNYIKNENYSQAKKEFLKADKIEPDNILILSSIANVENKLGNSTKSNRMLYELISKDSTYVNLYINLGVNLNKLKKYQEAEKIFLSGMKYIENKEPIKKSSYFLSMAATYKGLSDCENMQIYAKKGLNSAQNDFLKNFAKSLIRYSKTDCK